MKTTKYTIIINSFYTLIVSLFLLDSLTPFDIKSQTIKSFVYFGLLTGAPLTLAWNIFILKPKKIRVVGTVFSVLIIILIFVTGPLKILFSSAAWHTQTILYQNKYFKLKKIEFQMQDIGARGYNQRSVEVLYLTDLFMIAYEADIRIDKKDGWVKVDKEVNELGIKYP